MPNYNKLRQIYNAMHRSGDFRTTKSFEQFAQRMQHPDYHRNTYNILKARGVDTGSYEHFTSAVGAPTRGNLVQRKPTSSPAQQSTQQPLSTYLGSVEDLTRKALAPQPVGGYLSEEAQAEYNAEAARKSPYRDTPQAYEAIQKGKAAKAARLKRENRGRAPEVELAGRALNGDNEAAEALGVPQKMQQVGDQLDYEEATGKKLRNEIDLIGQAPTVARDEQGDIVKGENGEPLIGTTTDPARAAAYQQSVKHDKEVEEKYRREEELKKRAEENIRLENERKYEEEQRFKEEHPFLYYLNEWRKAALRSENVTPVEDEPSEAAKTSYAALSQLSQAQDLRGEAAKWGEASTLGRVYGGLWAGVKDPSTWDFGLSAAHNAIQIENAARSYERGTASQPQLDLLESAAIYNMAEANTADKLEGAYGAAKGLAGNLVFMGQFATNPASGVGSTAARQIAKTVGKVALKKFGKGIAAKAVTGLAKAAGRFGGDALEAGALTSIFSPARVVADYMDRRTGTITPDGKGGYEFQGREYNGVKALAKAINAQYAENLSEMWGEYLPGAGKIGALAGRGARKIGLGKVVDAFEKVNSSTWAKGLKEFQEKTHWDGLAPEFAEEFGNNLYVAITNGDMTLDDDPQTGVFNPEINLNTLQSVALMSGIMSGVKTVGYMRNKYVNARRLGKADIAARSAIGEARWNELKERIDSSDEKGAAEVMREIGEDKSLNKAQKKAALDYQLRSIVSKGANIQDVKNKMEGVYDYVDNAFDLGYSLKEATVMNNAKTLYEMAAGNAKQSGLSEEFITNELTPEKAVKTIAEMRAKPDVYPAGAVNSALDYVNYKAVYDGMIQRVQDDLDVRIAESDARIDGCKNMQSGNIQQGTLKQNDRGVYIVSGNVKMLDDGTGVNVPESDRDIIIRDIDTGKLEFVSPKDLLRVESEVDADTMKSIVAQQIRDAYATEQAGIIDGTLAFKQGDSYSVLDEEGKQHTVNVVADNGDGNVQVTIDDNAQPVVMPKEKVQQMSDAETKARVAPFLSDEKSGERYNLNDEILLRGEDGEPIKGVITAEENEDGMVEVQLDNGRVEMFSVPHLDKINITPQEEQTESPEEETGADNERDDNQEGTEDPSGTQALEDGEKKEKVVPSTDFPTDEQGQPIYEEIEPEGAWDILMGQAGDNAEIAQAVADDVVADKEAAVKKAESAKPKRGLTVAEKIAAERERRDNIARAKEELEHWKKIASVNRERVAAAQLEEAHKEEEATRLRKEQEEKDKAEREETKRVKRESLDGVPDVVEDTAANARARGYRRVGGDKVDRQQPLEPVMGKPVQVKFDDKNIPEGNVAIIDADELQPSHNYGQRNPRHFIDEAQPKERKDAASVEASRKIAGNMRPEEITSSVTAYTGAPTVNARGEVIQGNNRSAALKDMWASHKDQAEAYKEYLIKHAEEFGLNPDDIRRMKAPVLVNMLDVNDDDAIKLGQFLASDTESGGVERIRPKHVSKKLGGDVKTFSNILLQAPDEEMSLAELIDNNGVKALKWLATRHIITPTQYRSAFDSRGNLTPEAKNDIRGIMYQGLFEGGSTQLEEMFNMLPVKAQKAILATAYRDFDMPQSERMIEEIQNSIMAYYALAQDEQFAVVKNHEQARVAVESWKRQYAIDDSTGESYLPAKKYSNFALALATMYKGDTQKFIQNTFTRIYDIVQGTQEETLFESPNNTPRTLAQSIKEVLNIDYDGQKGSNVLGGNNTTSQTGGQRSERASSAGEQSATEDEAEDSRGGTSITDGEFEQDSKHSAPSENKGQKEIKLQDPRLMSDEEKERRGVLLKEVHAIEVAENQITATKELTARKSAERWWDENVAEPLFYDTEAGEVEINKTSIENSLAHRYGQMKLDAITSLPSGFENAVYLGTLPDSRERGVVDHYFAYPILYKGKLCYVFCRAMQDANKNSLYVHEVFVADKIKEGNTLQTAASKPHGGISLYKNILANVLDFDKDVSVGKDKQSSSPTKKETRAFTPSSKEDGEDLFEYAERVVEEQKRKAEEEKVNTSPTEKQKEAGNYKKGHIKVDGLDVTIEQPKGSIRSGKDANGKEWRTEMQNTYGYIRGTESVDGDHIDIFLSDNPAEGNVFVVDQVKSDGSFDEHKVMYGFPDVESARQAYLSNYEEGWQGMGNITEVSREEFKKWIDSSRRKTKPFAEYKRVQPIERKKQGLEDTQDDEHDIANKKELQDFVTQTDTSDRTAMDGRNYDAEDLFAPLLLDKNPSRLAVMTIVPDDINEPSGQIAVYDYSQEINEKTNSGWHKWDNLADEYNTHATQEDKAWVRGDSAMLGFKTVDAAVKFNDWLQEKDSEQSNGSSPVVMTEEDYLASKGLNTNVTDYTLDKLRIPHSETARQQAQREREAEQARADFDRQKEEARKEYREKIANGELREPTQQEVKEREIAKLIKTANGHEDNPGVQAARRVLDKRGIDWKQNKSTNNQHHEYQKGDGPQVNSTAEQQLATDAVLSLLDKAGVSVKIISNETAKEIIPENAEKRIVYHGSPAEFEQFEHSHMGEGEGAQAYGWGSYVTEVEGIGRSYAVGNGKIKFRGFVLEAMHSLEVKEHFSEAERKALNFIYKWVKRSNNAATAIEKAKEWASNEYGKYSSRRDWSDQDYKDYFGAISKKDVREWRKEMKEKEENAQQMLSFIETLSVDDFSLPQRHLYTVDIPDDMGSNYLKWDEPMSDEQLNAIEAYLKENYRANRVQVFTDGITKSTASNSEKVDAFTRRGENIYHLLEHILYDDKSVSEMLHSLGYTGISYPAEHRSGGREDGARNYVIFNEKDLKITDHVRFMKTQQGTVYGWTVGGRIYLTKAGLNPETPIHEYTHIWANTMMQRNVEGWKSIKELLKGTPVWEQVMNDPNYYDIKDDDDAVAGEVLSRISGKENAKVFEEQTHQMIEQAYDVLEKARVAVIIDNVRRALNKFWSWVGKSLFDIKGFKNIDEVTDRVLYDLVNATPLQITTASNSAKMQADTEKDIRFRDESGNESPEITATPDYNRPKKTIKIREYYSWDRDDESEDGPDNYDEVIKWLGLNRLRELYERESKGGIALVPPIPTMDNYYFCTTAKFKELEVGKSFSKKSDWEDEWQRMVDSEKYEYHKSPLSSSQYLLDRRKGDIYRYSDHWGEVSSCTWILEGRPPRYTAIGKCNIKDFKGKLYDKYGYIRGDAVFVDGITKGYEKALVQSIANYRAALKDPKLDMNDIARRTMESSLENLEKAYNRYLGPNRFQFTSYSNIYYRNNGQRDSLQEESSRKRFDIEEITSRIEEVSKNLGVKVRIVTDTSGLNERQSKAKGWFNLKTGEVVVVASNHLTPEDAMATVLHEAVAHYGLRQLFGEHFDTFLDDVFKTAAEDIRAKIVGLASNRGWDLRTAMEEYLASLAEDMNFEKTPNSFWYKIKELFLQMLQRLGFRDWNHKNISDNDLRYFLWRSYENLKNHEKNRGIWNEIEDTAKQRELQVGEYAPNDEGALFRDGEPVDRERSAVRDMYEREMGKSWYQTQEALQDSMLSLKRAMDMILKEEGKDVDIADIDGFENAYLGENRLSSVNKAEADAFAQLVFKPMLDEVAKLAKNNEERAALTDYMMAKHGLERNEVMRQREVEKINNDASLSATQKADKEAAAAQRDYAGLTALTGKDSVDEAQDAAEKMVETYEKDHDTTELWKKVNDVTNAILSKSYECGIIDKDTYLKIRDMYEFYIPLRGFEEETGNDTYAYLTGFTPGKGSASIKKAKGRTSKADDPFANLQSMAESAIMQGNRNKLVKQRFLNFALNHPSDLVSINDLWLRYDDTTGEWYPVYPDNIEETDSADEVEQKMADFEEHMQDLARQEPGKYKHGKDAVNIPYRVLGDSAMHQHQVIVKRGGRDYVLTVNGNPRLAQALNGLTNPDNDITGAIGEVLRLASVINRQLSAFYTTRNPDFIVSNFMRDMLYANSMVWVKESPNYALRFHYNVARCNPVQLKILLSKYKQGKLNQGNELEGAFSQFMRNGGETGYSSVRDIERHKNDIQKELKRANGKLGVGKAMSLLGERLDDYNRAVENCARFAAFLTSREMGRTIDRSIYDAKEISVNFNKKGAGAKFIRANGQTKTGYYAGFLSGAGRSFFVFWNAAIQGTTNFGRQFKRHPAKAFTEAAVMFLLGAAIAGLGMYDGDDDDKNSYWNLPEYVRRTNVLFKVGDYWISIPLPVEYRAIYGLGELMLSTISGKEHLTNTELGKAIAGQLSQVMPIDFLEGGGDFSNFIPSFIKPFAEAYNNKSWTGTPIYRDTPYNKNMPEWTKAFKKTNKLLVGLSRAINEATGGDDYTKGPIDDYINPAQWEYLLRGYFGGITSTIDELTKSAATIAGERDFDPKSFLLLNRVLKSGDENTQKRAIDREYARLRDEHDLVKPRLKHYEEDTDNGVFNYAEKINFLYNSPEYARSLIYDEYNSEIESLYKELKDGVSDEDRKEIENEIAALKTKAVEEANKTRK